MKKHVMYFLLALLASPVWGQEKPEYTQKIVRGKDGRLYVNKHLGVNLYIGKNTAPPDSLVKLTSEKHKEITSPFYFDTEGINTIRSPWAIDPESKEYLRPKQDVVFEVYSDGRPPQTRSFKEDKRVTNRSLDYMQAGREIALRARDAISGVAGIYYSINGQDYRRYSAPLAFTEEQAYTLRFYAVDSVGNDEEVHLLKFKVDQSAPQSSLEYRGRKHERIFSPEGSFLLDAEDEVSAVTHIYYRIDSAAWQTYKGAVAMRYLEEGAHTLEYYARDKTGNKEQPQHSKFYLDKSPPRIVQQIMGDQYYANGKAYSSGRSKIKITAVDNKAGVKTIYYSINNGERQKYKEPFLLPASKGGMQIKAYATDRVGNSSKGEIKEQARFKVTYRDLTGPNVNYRYAGPHLKHRDTLFIQPETAIKLAGTDDEAGFKKLTYQINNGQEKTYTAPLHIREAGKYTLTINGYDNVNNTTIKKLHFRVDNKGPAIYKHFSILPVRNAKANGDTLVYPKYTKLYLSATDKEIGVAQLRYKIGNASLEDYIAPIDVFSQKGLHRLTIVATDQLGNTTQSTVPVQIIP